MSLLTGKRFIMTGALGAIAEHVVRRIAENGGTIILTDILSSSDAVARVRGWGVPRDAFRYEPMDVTSPSEVDEVISRMFEQFPDIGVALGHAGGTGLHPFATTSQGEYDRIFSYNFLSQTYFARAILREWIRRSITGHMIFTSSLIARLPWPDTSAYRTAKRALEELAVSLSLEYRKHRIRFNCIAPGNMAVGSALQVYDSDKTYRKAVDNSLLFGGLIDPSSLADTYAWLASDYAREINGQVISVDRGQSLPKAGIVDEESGVDQGGI